MSDFTLAELCAVACAEAWRGDGEILASPMGTIPTIGARLAKATFAPDLVLSDGVATLVANVMPVGGTGEKVVEGWLPYRAVFDLVWWGRRHVMMGASQIDRFGNQNISCIGDWKKPKSQLLGVRGAPGNTINHATSYFVPSHGTKSFVAKVDVVSGVGYDRVAALGSQRKAALDEHPGRYHSLRRVVSNKGVFDFETPEGAMRLRSVHPGVSVDDVVANTGFPLVIPDRVETTRAPTAEELRLLREVIDPKGLGQRELRA
jgi:acyl CoA:acetate/3-ketoacid CoA transferase beta subunit